MKITASFSQEVEITDLTRKQIAKDYFCEKTKWGKHWFIKEGEVLVKRHFHSSHYFCNEVLVRKATKEDFNVFDMFSQLFN